VATSTTLTIRLSAQVKRRLGHLAVQTNCTKSSLAAEAISNFVEHELSIVEGIKRGLDDLRAGRVTPHKEAMRRLRATVAC
jgi:predicted transcriptional regulator